MLYWLKIYALISAFVFAGAGLAILALFVWHEVKAYASAQRRIYQRLANLFSRPDFSTSSFAISRTIFASVPTRSAHRGQNSIS
jgi:hypothetical protein